MSAIERDFLTDQRSKLDFKLKRVGFKIEMFLKR